ncbi:unnamed protein product [Chondrus crispus]|uniref:Tc3 transposase DNA binding domain-containing protein n=1 Tax=Chondrus crispus TaxID=2769 RepID=R7Q3H9_CHOCR|nr:unnamed protein product [Chondrus crispus]CDF32564.1 unnamed protein product [Chondrus crispus]|eukprot:XP_005712229.1 unnamed protein product [Chondrus crispus]
MPRGTQLTPTERIEINTLNSAKWYHRQIAEKLKRSKTVVTRLLNNPAQYGTIQRPGRPPKVTEAVRRRVIREASKKLTTASKIRKALELSVSTSTVQQIIRGTGFMAFKTMATAPWITNEHRKKDVLGRDTCAILPGKKAYCGLFR